MNNVQIDLISKPECHLCDDARAIIETVLAEFPAELVNLNELSILEDQQLYERHWEEIPVVKINGNVHDFWRVDPERFRAAVAAAFGRN